MEGGLSGPRDGETGLGAGKPGWPGTQRTKGGLVLRWGSEVVGRPQVSGTVGQVSPLGSGLTCGRPGASWAFLSCPPEDECANGHHDCNETQNCHDQPHGYECSCKTGYTMDK